MFSTNPGNEVIREGLAPLPELVRHLERASLALKLDPSEMRILDFGCGTGVAVEALRQDGWDVYGVDIDTAAIRLGNSLISGDRLRTMDASGQAPFPDHFFHFVYSQAVLEHVEHPETVAHEIRRLTAPHGIGLHMLPAPFRPIEPHISMPIVHWLPKNRARWLWILACCLLHVGLYSDINKQAVRGMGLVRKVDFEYDYLNNETYYRQFWQLASVFRRSGFRVTFPVLDHRRLEPFRPLLAQGLIGKPAEVLILSFVSIHLRTEVP